MLSLKIALSAERKRRRQQVAEGGEVSQIARNALQTLHDRLATSVLADWEFELLGDELLMFHDSGLRARHHVGSWTIGKENRLVSGPIETEWVTPASFRRVIDEAVRVTARIILDNDETLWRRGRRTKPKDVTPPAPTSEEAKEPV